MQGITQNLTNQLSRSSELFAITYSFSAKISAELSDTNEIAKSLGVRFILDGSVQRSGDKLRVNIELTDTVREIIVLTNQFDGDIDELFHFQDKIAEEIFANFKVKLAANFIGNNAATWKSVELLEKTLEFRKILLNFLKIDFLRPKN